MSELMRRIEGLVQSDRVVLFMKGSRAAPQCGFSSTVVEILDQYLPSYTTVNVLSDAEIRDGVKQYAEWPTIPQLFVDGQFVGGCDIIREMDGTGELVKTLGDLVRAGEPPKIVMSDEAVVVFRQALGEAGEGEFLRMAIDNRFSHELFFGAKAHGDIAVEANGITLVLDRGSARRADGVTIGYVGGEQPGFKIDNPNAPPSVKLLAPKEAKALLEHEPKVRFVDVRTPGERERATIPGTVLLDAESMVELSALPKDTPLLFHCHHGQRSQQAAMHFLEQGFRRVYNVVGGIEAWSRDVDPSIPRY
ncbi:MAG: Grx4 family monothiol glutaredoxin [Deltaproteobacteria bacterium]|nr:Grx4 family monothiol glutaredoxin [Nannocystaceae bacterium]